MAIDLGELPGGSQPPTHEPPRSWRTPGWTIRRRPVAERVFEIALLGALLGYLLFDKAFAWLHIPGTPLFVGEVTIVAGLAMLATTRIRLDAIARSGTPLVMLTLFVGWCAVRSLPGMQRYGIEAVRDLAIAYYGVFAWLVAVLLIGRRERLDRWFELYGRVIPVAAVWLGPALLLDALLGAGPPFVPDSQVSMFSHKISSIATHAMMGLLFLWLLDMAADRRSLRSRAVLTTLLVGAFGLAALLNRGSFVAVAAGIGVLWLMDRRRVGAMLRRVIAIGLVALAVAYAFDLRVPAFSTGREISAQQFVANVMSVVDPSAADESLSGTADWRLQYWRRLVADVNTEQPLIGLGFGPNLRERFGEQDEEVPARDAHNSHIGIYARSGSVGLALWFALWWTWFGHLLRMRRHARVIGDVRTANISGWLVAANVTMLVNAFFDPALEGPQVAIWVWTLFGVGAMLRPDHRSRRSALTDVTAHAATADARGAGT